MAPSQNQQVRNVVPAIVLITLGVLFLVGQIGGLGWLFGISWPLLIVGPGLIFLAVAFFGDRKAAGFFYPGSIITGIGSILAYQNMTGNWESWAYAWALIPVFVGIAMMFSSRRTGSEGEMHTGRNLVTWFGVTFIALAGFFELFIFDGAFGGLTRFIIPGLLILAGIYMFFGGRLPQNSRVTTVIGSQPEKAKVEEFAEPKRKIAPLPREEERLINLNGENKRVPAGENLRRRIDNVLDEDDSTDL